MLTVKTPDEVFALLDKTFACLGKTEEAELGEAAGRVLAETVQSREYVPDFDRSTVDGYAVRAADTFGCSESIPALLTNDGEILMGEGAGAALPAGCCRIVPTGGAVPEGADAVVMVEYTESYGDGTVGIFKPAAPGANVIYRGDDVYPGKPVLRKGRKLTAPDIGALAAMGVTHVKVSERLRVGIISTGDELVPASAVPGAGQIRDVNSSLLQAFCLEEGAKPVVYGIVKDEEALIGAAVDRALSECDAVLISGGSSVGTKDAACRIIESRGELLLHGIAIKPGKPTIMGRCGGKPVIGLPGHPGAAYFISKLFVSRLFAILSGRAVAPVTVPAVLTETVGANHGRAQINGVHLVKRGGVLCASPVHSKSGLITSLAGTDGYFCIGRDAEGVMKGDTVDIYPYSME